MPKSDFCEDYHREYLAKVCFKKNYNYGRSGFLKFPLSYGPMLANIKKYLKKNRYN